jgi:hypothetical protein
LRKAFLASGRASGHASGIATAGRRRAAQARALVHRLAPQTTHRPHPVEEDAAEAQRSVNLRRHPSTKYAERTAIRGSSFGSAETDPASLPKRAPAMDFPSAAERHKGGTSNCERADDRECEARRDSHSREIHSWPMPRRAGRISAVQAPELFRIADTIRFSCSSMSQSSCGVAFASARADRGVRYDGEEVQEGAIVPAIGRGESRAPYSSGEGMSRVAFDRPAQ